MINAKNLDHLLPFPPLLFGDVYKNIRYAILLHPEPHYLQILLHGA